MKLILELVVLLVTMMVLKKIKLLLVIKSFIGSNSSSLIAPVKIGNNVKIGAGSVINKNIPG